MHYTETCSENSDERKKQPMTWKISIAEESDSIFQNPQSILPSLAGWIQQQRWSGLASMKRVKLEVADFFNFAKEKNWTMFGVICRVKAQEQEETVEKRYFIPFFLTANPKFQSLDVEREIAVQSRDCALKLVEAELVPAYVETLLAHVFSGKQVRTTAGWRVHFASTERFEAAQPLGEAALSVLGGGDTTHVVIKASKVTRSPFVMKSYREIAEENPEADMLLALTLAEFPYAPKLLGTVTYRNENSKSITLAILESEEESEGDGRKPFFENLTHVLRSASTSPPEVLEAEIKRGIGKTAKRLGEIVADLHSALANREDKDFVPEKITEEDVTRKKEEILANFNFCLSRLEGRQIEQLPVSEASRGAIKALADEARENSGRFREQLRILDRTVGMPKTRTHQDLHLAQMLSRKMNDHHEFVIIDFEGDPQRKGEARKAKETPLRDLGCLCRSFGYVKYDGLAAVLRDKLGEEALTKAAEAYQNPEKAEKLRIKPVLEAASLWEQTVIDLLLRGYFERKRACDDEKLAYDLIRFWMMEKALLEIRYEITHRIEKLVIPLEGLLQITA